MASSAGLEDIKLDSDTDAETKVELVGSIVPHFSKKLSKMF